MQQVEGGDNIVEDMSNLLSRENMKELAKKTDEGSRYLLKGALHREIRSLILRYEIPTQEAELYISHFMTVIMHELEKEAPTVYQKAYLGEWREQEEKQLAEIKKSINLVNTQLREIQSRKVEVYSMDQQEIELAKQTANTSLNLSFFEMDEVFKEAFEEQKKRDKANKEKEKNLIKYLIGADISLSNQKLTDNSSSEESEKEEKSDEIQI